MNVRALVLLQDVGLDLARKKKVCLPWWLGTLHSAHAVASFSAESSSGRVLNPDIVWNQSVINMVDNTQYRLSLRGVAKWAVATAQQILKRRRDGYRQRGISLPPTAQNDAGDQQKG